MALPFNTAWRQNSNFEISINIELLLMLLENQDSVFYGCL